MGEIKYLIFRKGYKKIARPVFFSFDAEKVHKFFLGVGRFLGSNKLTKAIVSYLFEYEDKVLEQNILGINFKNPVGLAAGFDKDGEMISIMEDVGFGFTEMGSITAEKCEGNKGRRLLRFVNKKSLWVYLGLNNDGVDKIILHVHRGRIPLGINIAKTNSPNTVPLLNGVRDYIYTLEKLDQKKLGDYYVLNISCPNSFGGTDFCSSVKYNTLLKEIKKLKINKPIFVKLNPDLGKKEIDKIWNVTLKYKFVKGFICSNLTKKGNLKKGGLSGKVVESRANEQIKHLYPKIMKSGRNIILIGTGGIFSAEDAYKKIKLGANIVQLFTGMIFEGPSLIGEINYNLAKMLKAEGYRNISEAVGSYWREQKHI